MKKLFLLLVSFGVYGYIYAAIPVAEAPINGVGTPVTISVSSATLTKIPTTQTSGRMGFYINNPSTTSIAGFLGDCTSTALASTIRPIQFAVVTANTGPGLYYLPLREDICLWAITLDTVSRSIHIQEVKQ